MPITTTPGGGPQGDFSTYTPIYSQTLSATTSSITFSNIPTTFTDLVLVVTGIGATGTTFPWMRFNGLSTSIYSDTHLYGIPSGSGSTRRTSNSRGYIAEQVEMGTTQIATTEVHIMNYANTTTFKTYLVRNTNGASSGTYVGTEALVGLARLTSPITSITVGTASGGTDYNFASGSSFTLYGIKAATPAPKATGGDVVTTDGTYWYHAFKNTGLFDVKTPMSVDYLVVAGGGGGGIAGGVGGGGGGAGGYRTSTSYSVTTQGYLVTIGAGGAGSSTTYKTANGSDSTFAVTTSAGGGTAGSYSSFNGGNTGGSGGGGGGYIGGAGAAGNTPSTSPSQGNAGGNGGSGSTGYAHGGGGGGAGAAGANASGQYAGNGGAGVNTLSSWLNATSTGVNGYIAGGGGGGSYDGGQSYYAGTGGAGGGGNGGARFISTGTAGTANTGGGGGGDATGDPKNGGSGLVIVRYAV
jgi:hypothetical protein